jgi:hypothetical protein
LIGHLLFSVALQAAVFMICRSWVAGAAAATTWAVSREIAQAEYRWIERFGDGLRENMPWWAGLDFRVWQGVDPWLDWIVPCIATLLVALVARRLGPAR